MVKQKTKDKTRKNEDENEDKDNLIKKSGASLLLLCQTKKYNL